MLGSGNVATHLANALARAGHRIVQVYSRNIENASLLAHPLGAQAIDDLRHLDTVVDMVILAVSDDAIPSVAEQLPRTLSGVVVHTSGTTPMDVLQPFSRHGVFYPLQTFSKSKAVDFRSIPLALEASDDASMAQLEAVAKGISDAAFACDSAQRLALHVAAVFACNFTNHLYAVAAALLERNGLAFDLIKPLVMETAQKIMALDPAQVQTGPAVRGDQKTMDKHLEFLKKDPEWQRLYGLLSEGIQATRNKR